MDSIHKAISEVIEKCDVCLAGNVISKELLIRTFSDFISTTIENKKHNIGIVLHTGSICFDAVLLAYARQNTGAGGLAVCSGDAYGMTISCGNCTEQGSA